jgi:hypothetical protein
VYGTSGKNACHHSTKELKRVVRDDATWSNAGMERACYWVPYCLDKACVCGGSRKQGCKFGENGTHIHEAPKEEIQIVPKDAWINKGDAENLRQCKIVKHK